MTSSAADSTEYDLIVLGAGAVGENVADRAVQGGLTAVIVEHELVGGECSYWACMPSKALLRSAQALRAAQRGPGAAEAVTGELDVAGRPRAPQHLHARLEGRRPGAVAGGAGIDLVRGHGRITGPEQVTVTAARRRGTSADAPGTRSTVATGSRRR